MNIFRRILNEFWLPAIISISWTAYNAFSSKTPWSIRDYINSFGPTFFIIAWISGQFFRIKKSEGVDRNLGIIDTRVEALMTANKAQFNTIKLMFDAFQAERRANPSGSAELEEVIPLSRVVEFYDQIAISYNRRNTENYLETYGQINAAIRSTIPNLKGLSICDLGGGTGTLLKLFTQDDVHWTNIDLSKKSLKVFETDFSNYVQKISICADIRGNTFMASGQTFDILVMNYILSSLDMPPDFSVIIDAMHEKSILVIADNHNSYVQKYPRYGYKLDDGRTLSIRPRPMKPDELREQIQAAGFIQLSYKLVLKDGSMPYSQINIFQKSNR